MNDQTMVPNHPTKPNIASNVPKSSSTENVLLLLHAIYSYSMMAVMF